MDIDLATGDDLQSATSEAFQLAIDNRNPPRRSNVEFRQSLTSTSLT